MKTLESIKKLNELNYKKSQKNSGWMVSIIACIKQTKRSKHIIKQSILSITHPICSFRHSDVQITLEYRSEDIFPLNLIGNHKYWHRFSGQVVKRQTGS